MPHGIPHHSKRHNRIHISSSSSHDPGSSLFSALMPTPACGTMAMNNPTWWHKGCEEFSRRDSIQKKPKELRISLRQNRAFLSKNPVRMHVRAGTGSPHLQPSGITYCAKCTPSTWTLRLRRGRRCPHPQHLPTLGCLRPRRPASVRAAAPGPAAVSLSSSLPSWPTGRLGWW
jgi:hypothetical protein